MPSISFQGAQNFTISGGNFGDIAGGVVSYSPRNRFQFTRTNAFTEYVDAAGTNTEPRPPSRTRDMLAQRRSTGSPPPRNRIKSVPHRSDSAPVSQALMRLGSPPRSENTPRAPTPPPTPEEPCLSSPTSSTISSLTGYLTPPMDHQPDGVDIELTPLTESLGLNSQLTPSITLSAVRGIPVDTQEQMDVQHSVPEDAGNSIAQPTVGPSHTSNTFHIREISNPNPPPLVPLRSKPKPSSNDSSVECVANHRLGPPPPLPPRPMVASAGSKTAGAKNFAQYRMQNFTELVPRTSSPEPMQLERSEPNPNPCLPRKDASTRQNAGSQQHPARNITSSTMPAQPDIPTVSQDGFGPLVGTPTLSTVSELSVAGELHEQEPHWTNDSIGNWADHVKDTDGTQERREDFQRPCSFEGRRYASQGDHPSQPSLHNTSFYHSGQYTNYPSYSSGFCGISQQQVPLYHPYFQPYSFSGFHFNPPVSQGHPYGSGVILVAPWPGV